MDDPRKLRTRALETAVRIGLPQEMLEFTCLSDQDAVELSSLLHEQHSARVLEIGAFVGVSTCVLACACSTVESVVSVDPGFFVAVEGERFGLTDRTATSAYARRLLDEMAPSARVELVRGYFSRKPHPAVLERPIALGEDADSRPIVAADVGARFGPFDFVFIDGDHHAVSVESDLNALVPHLAPRATIVLHDFAGGWGTEVRAGAVAFLAAHPEFRCREAGNLGVVSLG